MAKVLLADDGELIRVKAARMLAVEGFTVVEAENGSQAVTLFQTEKPDIVLLDISMPQKNSLTVLREIRTADPEAKVVMMSAPGQEPAVLEAIRAGAKDYIIKPFEKDRLLNTIRKLLGIAL
jgi:two-component system chemotaxis response regulator CheY